MFGKSVVFLFSGKAGTGKSTSANYLREVLTETNFSFFTGSFATEVKTVASTCYGWDGKKDERGRRLLQEVGAIGRRYNPDIWVDKLFNKVIANSAYYPYAVVVIDDWRFLNEYEFILQNGLYKAYTLRVDAPNRESLKGSPLYDDISEVDLDNFDFDYRIDNTGTFEQLYRQLDLILKDIIQKEDTYKGENL